MGNLAWFTGRIIKRVYKLKNTKFKVANLKKNNTIQNLFGKIVKLLADTILKAILNFDYKK